MFLNREDHPCHLTRYSTLHHSLGVLFLPALIPCVLRCCATPCWRSLKRWAPPCAGLLTPPISRRVGISRAPSSTVSCAPLLRHLPSPRIWGRWRTLCRVLSRPTGLSICSQVMAF